MACLKEKATEKGQVCAHCPGHAQPQSSDVQPMVGHPPWKQGHRETEGLAWALKLCFCFHIPGSLPTQYCSPSHREKTSTHPHPGLVVLSPTQCELMCVTSETLTPSESTNNTEFLGLPDPEADSVTQWPHPVATTLRPLMELSLTVPEAPALPDAFLICHEPPSGLKH